MFEMGEIAGGVGRLESGKRRWRWESRWTRRLREGFWERGCKCGYEQPVLSEVVERSIDGQRAIGERAVVFPNIFEYVGRLLM